MIFWQIFYSSLLKIILDAEKDLICNTLIVYQNLQRRQKNKQEVFVKII